MFTNKIKSKNNSTSKTKTFLFKAFEGDEEQKRKTLRTILKTCPAGTQVSVGSFGCNADKNPIIEFFNIKNNSSNEIIEDTPANKEPKINTYLFIQIVDISNNPMLSITLSRCMDMLGRIREINSELAQCIDKNLTLDQSKHLTYWDYDSLQDNFNVNLIPNITSPYFMIESFLIHDRATGNTIKPLFNMTKIFRTNNSSKVLHENKISDCLDEGGFTVEHIGSHLTLFNANEGQIENVQNVIKSKAGIIKSKSFDSSRSLSDLLVGVGGSKVNGKKRLNHSSCMTDKDMIKTFSLSDMWDGNSIDDKIIKFKTVNNREFGFDLFTGPLWYSLIILEKNIDLRNDIANHVLEPYLKNESRIHRINLNASKINSVNSFNKNPFTLNIDKYELPRYIALLILAINEKNDVSNKLIDKLSKQIKFLMEESRETPTIDDLYQTIKTEVIRGDNDLEGVANNLFDYTSNGKFNYIFDHSKNMCNNKDLNPDILVTQNTLNLMLEIMEITSDILNSIPIELRFFIVLSNISQNIQTNNITQCFFDSYYRIMKKYTGSFIIMDNDLFKTDSNLGRMLCQVSHHKIINMDCFDYMNSGETYKECIERKYSQGMQLNEIANRSCENYHLIMSDGRHSYLDLNDLKQP